MEWDHPGIILRVAPFGEADALVHVFTQAGVTRALVRGGLSRRHAATWQQGNLVQARWVARLPDQLGSLTGEIVHAAAAEAMADPLSLAVLSAACAVAEGALPERDPMPAVFAGLLHVIAHVSQREAAVAALIGWEIGLLSALGYGLDLRRCALTGATEGLTHVSPRTGRAVCAEAAGAWRERLLPLPAFLAGDAAADETACVEGLALTGHFLARDVFGTRHVALPQARLRLADLVNRVWGRPAEEGAT